MNFTKKDSKLFILSGKAGSGKNECAKIIENYYKSKKCITISFGHYIKDYVKRITGWDGNETTKPSDLLQNIGIELIKNKIDDKLFINRILEDILVFSYFYDIIIVSDARLIDEVKSLKEVYVNSVSIRINRKNYSNGLTSVQNNHITETNLDDYNDFDYIINNDSKYQLERVLFSILEEVNK